jgi:hypothetical protein
MEGPTSFLRAKEQETRLILHELMMRMKYKNKLGVPITKNLGQGNKNEY